MKIQMSLFLLCISLLSGPVHAADYMAEDTNVKEEWQKNIDENILTTYKRYNIEIPGSMHLPVNVFRNYPLFMMGDALFKMKAQSDSDDLKQQAIDQYKARYPKLFTLYPQLEAALQDIADIQ